MKRRFFVSLLAFALTFSLLSSGIMIYAADAGAMTNGDNSEGTLSETSENEDAEESSVEETESDEGFAESTAEDTAASDLTAEEMPEEASEDELYVTEDPAEVEETDEAAADDTIVLEATVEDTTIRIFGDAEALSGVASLTAVSLSDERIGEYEAALADEDGGMEILAGYSITLLDAAGNAVEPDGTVSVSVTSDALKACQAGGNMQIIHNLNTTADAMEDDAVDSETISVEALEVVSAVSDGSGEIDFTMDSFSEIVIPGGSGIALTAANVTYVAEVEGGSQYETLAEAIDAVPDGGTVTLLGDIDLTGYITIGKSITLDLNGQTITEESGVTASDSGFEYTSGSYCLIYISDTGSLTIQDSGNGGNITAATIPYCIAGAGAITMENGTIAATTSSGRAINVTGGSVNISGGEVTATARGILANGAVSVAISGGTITTTGSSSRTVALQNSAELTFSDGNILNINSGFTGMYVNSSTVQMSGGTIETNSSASYAYGIYIIGESTVEISAGSIIAEGTSSNLLGVRVAGDDAKLDMSGGSISATGNSYVYGLFGYDGAKLDVSGGNISAISDSYAYGIYGNDGVEITLGGDSTSVFATNYGMYIYTSDVTVTGGSVSSTENAALGVYYGSNVVVEDGSFSGNWALSTGGNTSYDETKIIINGGTFVGKADCGITSHNTFSNIYLEINGGSIYGVSSGIYMPNDGTLVINGGTITGTAQGVHVRNGDVIINGGTIVSLGTYSGSNGNYALDATGAAISVVQHVVSQTYTREISVTINGGTFIGTKYGLYEENLQGNSNTGEVVSIDINGGTFTVDSSGESVKVNTRNTNGSRNGTYIVSITGGYFSKHVYSSDYIADGYICIDNLTGTYSGYHAVVPDTITSANTVVTLSETSFVYNAQAQVPSVTVALAGVTLTEGKHYTVSYSDGSAVLAAANVINVGDYTVTVTGTGSTALCEVFAADTSRQSLTLSGSAAESFEITAATPTVALTGVSSKTYDGETVSAPAVSVSLVGSDTYSGTPVITYYSVASDGTLTKLDGAPSAVGDYMVVVEVSDAGDNYNSASASATFTISEAGTDADDTDDQEDDDTTTSSAASEETSADASSAVQTGDTNPVLPLAGACAAALAVIAVLAVRRRKRA